MSETSKRVVILGGGITGLTTAFYLQKEAREKKLPIEVILIEATHRLGGKIQTVVRDGFVIERGPDSFIARKQSASRLAKEVGIGDQLVSNTAGKSYVLAKGRLHPMPGGSIMGIPTQIGPFITTGLFSLAGKMRAGADFVLPRSNAARDQSLGHFFRRRLGDEVVENLIEPLLSGIYAGDIDQMSLMSTFPQFYEVEQKYRSLVIGMKKGTPAPKKSPAAKGSKKGMFLTPKGGLQSFVDAIEDKLDPHSIRKGQRVEYVRKTENGYNIRLNSGETLQADTVVSTVSHQVLPAIFPDYEFFEIFEDVPSTSVANVALAFPREAIAKDIDGTGFVVSRNSDYTITACTWGHKKWPHSCPEDKVLLRCFVGRAGDETVVDLSDDEIIKIVLEDMNKTMNITMEPEFAVISRWKNAMPQYTVGHKERLAQVLDHVNQELPGVFIAGSSFEGLGIPDCIDQGEAAVQKVLNYLK
ncbi:protoporphyrinogen oxidase [Robertmurraya andreesenii]|uniref:Coproporphyrinogen III oxidase n=1 Tax=Anoxybacillus andreesenii TaxID=1325932 RepID=A0ABT9UYK5_9BACL|nr:protoporphyrinogen oxidase [Robertmurraya andreesenii]MDQ0153778.1 oxygen-dependent protoporphyrinogen oxidase [Robertmurraya andreesenii]